MNKIFDNKKVLQKRISNNISFNDYDIAFDSSSNSAETPKLISFRFDRQLSKIYLHFNKGIHKDKLITYEDTKSLIKNIEPNEDGNGNIPVSGNLYRIDGNYLYFIENEKKLIKKITAIGTNANTVTKLIIGKGFDSLIEIDALVGNTLEAVDLTNVPRLKILKYRSWAAAPVLDLSNTHLKFVQISIHPNADLSKLPISLEYFRTNSYAGSQVIDLSVFFNGNRIGLHMENGSKLTYNGGAIFPSTINEDSDYIVEFIIHQPNIANKLTGDELSRFLIDFANQVTACNLTDKRMRFQGSTPNTSYTDNSQPLFKTYASALAHITGTLGVTVQFT